jgi:hypothetical protein
VLLLDFGRYVGDSPVRCGSSTIPEPMLIGATEHLITPPECVRDR